MTLTMTKQAPIGSGFGAKTTAREAIAGVDLRGKVAIVTGGYAGIGTETTRALVEAGATVVAPARSPEKARAALAGIDRVELEALDLADPASIDAFAQRFLASGRALHILVNNAGIMACPLERDARGFEPQLATNHIGHFQLTARLWPALARAKGARVVSVSSRGHRRSKLVFDDPHYERRTYDKWEAYGQSKTANVLFAVALDARGEKHGVRAFAVHPGVIRTDLARHLSKEEFEGMLSRLPNLTWKTPEQGAATSVWCAASPRLSGMGGVYCEDVEVSGIAPDNDPTAMKGVNTWAIDRDAAERLWALTEKWTGVSFRP
ncbi:MAG TPA: oxidoreductase [Planctomycetota bacterium]|nr:oxidoreductase [Planctomycetota bacterium]